MQLTFLWRHGSQEKALFFFALTSEGVGAGAMYRKEFFA